ncbi:glycoside hydrolase family 30 beta sandwich domain-containing protein [Marinimicrobium alkaliphilum]|uniref:glycoside hydrolase family 30 beta sandwich domain-containing protein n=1 Tax=Marinimicrobium alkaliphilum TaxID=2202654 RepID=UPI001E293A82|nr:glycoside hydrolase family 30 beta sandwich domain-containing protein [Marinimicrobium alkaliphilum]
MLKRPILFTLFASLLLLAACGSDSNDFSLETPGPPPSPEAPEPDEPTALNLHIDPETAHQRVAGFGGAVPMWTVVSTALTDEEVRTLVGSGDDQLGITLLRTIIDPDPGSWSRAAASLREAKEYSDEVTILATVWSPPPHMKDNNSVNNGGRLLPEYYSDFADHLNDYIAYMASEGVEIDVVSPHNEPDYHPNYESAEWSGEDIRNFVRDYGDRIQARLLIGESLRFDRAYTDPSLNDPDALANFDIVGGHLYSAEQSGTFTPYPLAEEKNKERWMTEWNFHEADGDGAPIWGDDNLDVWDETLDVVLASVHQSMDVNWNAYIWWWMLRFYSFIGDGQSEFGTERGEVLKRGWGFSHYSLFVRPGYQRIGADADGSDNVHITAYRGDDDRLVAVILNRSETSFTDVPITLPAPLSSAEGFVTSRSENRAPLAVTLDGDSLTIPTLDARSIITVVMYP